MDCQNENLRKEWMKKSHIYWSSIMKNRISQKSVRARNNLK